jgi:hypothetical protein
MLGDMDLTKRPRFHWKYHPLVAHPLTGLFRALLASCNSDIAGPANGAEFIALAERLGLGDITMSTDDTSDDVFASARLAAAQAAAAAELQRAERLEAVEASAEVLGAVYDRVLQSVEALISTAQLPLSLKRDYVESAATALARLGRKGDSVVNMFRLVGKRPFGDFTISLVAAYHPYPAGLGLLPFSFTLQVEDAVAIPSNSFAHRRDASFVRASSLDPVPVPDNYLVTLIKDYISSPATWDPQIL